MWRIQGAYPADHPLPRLASSNHRAYALRHGYRYRLETEVLAPERPPAWGKVRLLQRLLEEEMAVMIALGRSKLVDANIRI